MSGKNIKVLSACAAFIIVILSGFSVMFINQDKTEATDKTAEEQYFPFEVDFIDVGQGDSTLIQCEGKNILIDAGLPSEGRTVEEFLIKEGVSVIDCFVLTHPHADHIGGASHIIRNFDVKKIFMTYFSEVNIPTTATYEDLIDTIIETGTEVEYVEGGSSYTFGKLEMKILSPYVETDDYNDMSVVINAKYKNASVLLTGDASSSVEKDMLKRGDDIKADILKVGHHGSSTSSYRDFVKQCNPVFAVISCGKNNKYGHPHEETMKTFGDTDIKLYRTDKDGTVSFVSEGKGFKLKGAA